MTSTFVISTVGTSAIGSQGLVALGFSYGWHADRSFVMPPSSRPQDERDDPRPEAAAVLGGSSSAWRVTLSWPTST